MSTPEGLPSLEDALGAAAVVEGFGDDPEDVLFPEEHVEDADATAPVEQAPQEAEAAPAEEPSLFADLVEAEEAKPSGVVDWTAKVVLPGIDEEVPLSEMKDGYLRQADYTKKTQRLAEDRKAFEAEHSAALQLMKALEADPAGTAAALAVKVGLITEDQIGAKVRDLQGAYQPPPTREAIEAEVEKRVAEAVAKHPTVLQATAADISRRVDAEFARIEGVHGLKLTTKDRLAVLKKAAEAGTTDLELVVDGMLRRIERRVQAQDTASAAAPARPAGRAPSPTAPVRPKTVEDAFAMALDEMKGQRAS